MSANTGPSMLTANAAIARASSRSPCTNRPADERDPAARALDLRLHLARPLGGRREVVDRQRSGVRAGSSDRERRGHAARSPRCSRRSVRARSTSRVDAVPRTGRRRAVSARCRGRSESLAGRQSSGAEATGRGYCWRHEGCADCERLPRARRARLRRPHRSGRRARPARAVVGRAHLQASRPSWHAAQAAGLDRLGIGQGERVAIVSQNAPAS